VPELSAEQVRRYARHILLPDVGGVGQRRLLAATVRVDISEDSAGAQVALAYLAAAGVGRLLLAGRAHDPVTPEDVAGGVLLGREDIGRERRAAMAERIHAINPDVTVQADDDAAAEAVCLPPDADAGAGADAAAGVADSQTGLDADARRYARGQRVATALATGGRRAARTLAQVLEQRIT
jgi:hypothetical protein